MNQDSDSTVNRFQLAIDILQKGREVLVRDLADQIIDREEDFVEGGFLFQEFLENQGSKLHFLYLMISQLEQSAEQFEEEVKPPGKYGEEIDSPESEVELPVSELVDEQVVVENFFRDFELAADQEMPDPPKPKRKRRKKIDTKSSLPSSSDEGE
jgi:hypothetical protein